MQEYTETLNMSKQIINDFWSKPYHDAGHDIESVFSPAGKCSRCGSYTIDLSEDLMYGKMRKCKDVKDVEQS